MRSVSRRSEVYRDYSCNEGRTGEPCCARKTHSLGDAEAESLIGGHDRCVFLQSDVRFRGNNQSGNDGFYTDECKATRVCDIFRRENRWKSVFGFWRILTFLALLDRFSRIGKQCRRHQILNLYRRCVAINSLESQAQNEFPWVLILFFVSIMASRLSWQTWRARPLLVSSFTLLGVGAFYTSRSFLFPTSHAESPEPAKTFGGFGFTTLRLQSSTAVNHNTKRLVFEFPDETATSGLSLTCTFSDADWGVSRVLTVAAALLTISRPEGRWLPVLRPYTPISSLSRNPDAQIPQKCL